MQFSALRRTTTFRLSLLYGLLFALGTIALLGMVYLRSAGYLTRRVDGILNTEADALMHSPRPGLRERLDQELTLNGSRTNVYGLFTSAGEHMAGNLDALPPALLQGNGPVEIAPTTRFPASARLIARRLPGGEILVVGRDVSQLQQMRAIITQALIWSGVLILVAGLAMGVILSAAPLQRLRRLQAVAQDIARGDLKRRMPVSDRGDELDAFAGAVNFMIGEVERLIAEVKGATEVIAHDLLSPLANASLQLRRIQRSEHHDPLAIERVTARLDEVLERFRAILRIAELDVRQRRAAFATIDLAEVIGPVSELYQPLAESTGVRLLTTFEAGTSVEADPKLLFEAVSNLVDNAIKFGGSGSTVRVHLGPDPRRPQIIVEDDGPGIPAPERSSVLQRFYRGERNRAVAGSGLGLSVVAAIVRLHEFALTLEDAKPGLRVVIECHPVSGTGIL
ncbi:MAG TPA: HAMP domain-containing sensor histidine kinase [Steroidobacteraceae bacterium]|nr:HAMP domain-containing sensor histidine kinase [Steroidobacteraceae bacterium]